jgi:hypothetical protein
MTIISRTKDMLSSPQSTCLKGGIAAKAVAGIVLMAITKKQVVSTNPENQNKNKLP